ncbi:MAG: amino acid ABC transporter permease [Eubacteriales bacterium]
MLIKIIETYHEMLFTAMGQTLLLAFVSLLVASVLGLIFGIMNTMRNRTCKIIATIYVDAIRGWPLIVLAFFVYFGFPMFVKDVLQISGFRLSALQAGVIALSLNCGAYMAEIIRAGILSVDVGQMEAARSLGMSYPRSMARVVVPQAIRTMIPSIINQFIITLKDTSILTVIGFPELTNTAKTISANTMRPLETWFITGVLYMVVILILSKLSKVAERKINRGR